MLGNGVVILGPDASGKSQLFRRFVGGNFVEAYQKGALHPEGFDLWIDAEKFLCIEELSGLSTSSLFKFFHFFDPEAHASINRASILLMCVDVSSEAAITTSIAYYKDTEVRRMGLSGALKDGELNRVVVFTKVDLNPDFNPALVLLRLAGVGITSSTSSAYFSTSARTRHGVADLILHMQENFSEFQLCEFEPDTAVDDRVHIGDIDYRQPGAEADDIPAALQVLADDDSAEIEGFDFHSDKFDTHIPVEDIYKYYNSRDSSSSIIDNNGAENTSHYARFVDCWAHLFAACFGRRADESETTSSDFVAKP